MITQPEQHAFDEAVNQWIHAARVLAAGEHSYAEAYAKALIAAEGPNEAKRQAVASLAAGTEWQARELARVTEQASRWRVSFCLAAIGRRQPPV